MEYSEQSSGYISRGQIKKISENIKMYLQHPQPTSNRTEKCAKKPTKRTEIACLWHNGHSFSPAVTATSWSHFCRLTQGLYGTVCCEPLQAEVSALLYQAQKPVSHPVPQPAAPLLTAISCVTSNHCVRINAFTSFCADLNYKLTAVTVLPQQWIPTIEHQQRNWCPCFQKSLGFLRDEQTLLWSHGKHPSWGDVGGFVQFLSLLFCCSRAYKQLPAWLIIASSKITLVNVCKIWVHWESTGGWERKRREILMTSV